MEHNEACGDDLKARELYTYIKDKLNAAGLTASVEANVLFEKATGKLYTALPFNHGVSQDCKERADNLIERRTGGEPLQYIAGKWPFLDFELEVGEGVLIPRPETENIAEKAVELLDGTKEPVVLDLCSGTGCIAIAIKRAKPQSKITAVELFKRAFEYMCANINRLAPGIEEVEADIVGYERQLVDSGFDMIVSNPPYVTPDEYQENISEIGREPQSAFIGGEDGLDFYRYITKHYKSKLKPGGTMLFETGFNQTAAVEKLFLNEGFSTAEIYTDTFGLPRMVAAKN